MAETHPCVSVVIPTYNRAMYVTRAIDSVLAQTYTDWEIIVVDDGSTDQTPQALAAYNDRIRYMRQENQGPAAARNTGVQAARGQWIAFLDSDDEWLPQKLAVQIAHTMRRPDLVAHVTNVRLQTSEEPAVRRFDPARWQADPDGMIVLDRPACHVLQYGVATLPAFMARKDALLRIGMFDTRLMLAEDVDLFLRLALEGPWGVCPQELVHCHRRKESGVSLSERMGGDWLYRCRCVIQAAEKVLTDSRLSRQERRTLSRTLAWWVFRMGKAQRQAGEKTQALASYRKAFRLGPSMPTLLRVGLSALSTIVAPGTPAVRAADLHEK